MSDFNALHNRAVWFDIPVSDLGRAAEFYRAVLDVKVDDVDAGGYQFCVIEHAGRQWRLPCPESQRNQRQAGILLYMNVDGRIRDAVAKTTGKGGKVLEPTHGIGPHGFRAIVLDSEGNRIALHSSIDA